MAWIGIHKRTVEAALKAAETIKSETKFKETRKTWNIEKPRASSGIEVKPSKHVRDGKHDITITCSYNPKVGCHIHGVSEGFYADTARTLRMEIKKIEGCDIAESADTSYYEYFMERKLRRPRVRRGLSGVTTTYYACKAETPEKAAEIAVKLAEKLEKAEESEEKRIRRIEKYIEAKLGEKPNPGTVRFIRERSLRFLQALNELITTKTVLTPYGPRRVAYPKTPRDIEEKILKYMKYD